MRTRDGRRLLDKAKTYFSALTGRGILLSVCALILVGVSTTALQMNSVAELKQLANQEENVAGNTYLLNDILLSTVDAETGQRGYLLTGDPLYLATYNSALPKITADFKKLKSTYQDRQNTDAINALQSTVNQKLWELQSTLTAMNTNGFSAAVSIVNTNKGLNLMNSITSQVNSINKGQGTALSAERGHVLDQIGAFQAVLVAVRLSAFVLILIGMYLIGRVLYQRYELEKSKGEFIDIAAHQLRTPASVVKLHLGAILNGYMGKVPPSHVDALRNAYESNEHEIQIIEDVLRVAKVDNGETALHKKSVNVKEILTSAVRSTDPVLNLRKQKLVREFPKQQVVADLDPMYVQMVVENLLDNASKYSSDGTEITLGLESVGPWTLIRVTDKGVGVSRRDKSKLFKKFSRIESELSDSITGTGLGLYWAQQIAELHGGKITVRSRKGKGSTFTLVLPTRALQA